MGSLMSAEALTNGQASPAKSVLILMDWNKDNSFLEPVVPRAVVITSACQVLL